MEGGAEDLLPIGNGQLLGGGGKRSVDCVAGVEGRIDDRVRVGGRVEMRYVILFAALTGSMICTTSEKEGTD